MSHYDNYNKIFIQLISSLIFSKNVKLEFQLLHVLRMLRLPLQVSFGWFDCVLSWATWSDINGDGECEMNHYNDFAKRLYIYTSIKSDSCKWLSGGNSNNNNNKNKNKQKTSNKQTSFSLCIYVFWLVSITLYSLHPHYWPFGMEIHGRPVVPLTISP